MKRTLSGAWPSSLGSKKYFPSKEHRGTLNTLPGIREVWKALGVGNTALFFLELVRQESIEKQKQWEFVLTMPSKERRERFAVGPGQQTASKIERCEASIAPSSERKASSKISLSLRSALTESLRRVFTVRTLGAPPEQCVNTPVRVILVWLTSIGNEKGWSVFLPSEYQARRPKVPFRSRRVARTVGEHYCTSDTWNLSDASIGNEKGHSVFLPSKYQARRPKVPFCSRRVARTVGEHYCTSDTWNLSDASIGNEKGQSVFLPSEYQARRPKVPFCSRRVARTVGEHFCTRFILEIYLTLRSATRKVRVCFYPQNIRRAARKFLSAQGASPEQWVNTSVRVLYLKSIWRFDRQWERLQRVFTLRTSGASVVFSCGG